MEAEKKLLSKIIFGLAALLILTGVPLGKAFAAVNTAVEDAQYGVVRVIDITEVKNDTTYYNTGTGFIVNVAEDGSQTIVTNCHVIEEAPDAVHITISDFYNSIEAEVLYADPDVDIAILVVREKLADRYPLKLLSPASIHKSQDIYCLGFPGAVDAISTNVEACYSGIDYITITKGTVSNPNFTIDTGIKSILTDAMTSSGNSGGPMVDEYGQVIGVNSWGVEGNVNGAVSIDYVMEILDYLGIEYESGIPEAEREVPSAVVEVQTKVSEPEVTVSSADDGSEPGTASPAAIALIAVIIIAVIALVLIVVRAVKTNKNTARGQWMGSPGSSEEPTVEQEDVGVTGPLVHRERLIITCERGAAAGERVESTDPVCIGRDPSKCRFVFPSNTPGISKVHCKVSAAEFGILLEDMGSTYGTFVRSGAGGSIKLDVHNPLAAGENCEFYLGDMNTKLVAKIERHPGTR